MVGVNDTTHQQTPPSGNSAMFEAMGLRRLAGERVLLDDVSLSIRGGDRIAIVGPTGSGCCDLS